MSKPEISKCGDCAGCEIDRVVRSMLDELTSFYIGRARQLQEQRADRGFVDRDADRREEKMLRLEWDTRATAIMKEMRPVGCLAPRTYSNAKP
jgi:hypothetical protein